MPPLSFFNGAYVRLIFQDVDVGSQQCQFRVFLRAEVGRDLDQVPVALPPLLRAVVHDDYRLQWVAQLLDFLQTLAGTVFPCFQVIGGRATVARPGEREARRVREYGPDDLLGVEWGGRCPDGDLKPLEALTRNAARPGRL